MEELKSGGKAVPESEEHLRSVAETATEAIITIDSNGKVIFWNPAAERMFGFSGEEMRGKPLSPIVPENLPTLKEVEEILIEEALERSGGNQAIAARILWISRQALNNRLQRKRQVESTETNGPPIAK